MENLSPLLQATINNSNSGTKVENTSLNTNKVQQPAPKNNLAQDKFTPNTRFTKKGNHYEKTNIAKIVGLIGGALYGAYQSIGIKKVVKEINLCEILNNILMSVESSINSREAERIVSMAVKKTPNIMITAVMLASILAGLAIGGAINFVINKVKAYKADKEAQAQ